MLQTECAFTKGIKVRAVATQVARLIYVDSRLTWLPLHCTQNARQHRSSIL